SSTIPRAELVYRTIKPSRASDAVSPAAFPIIESVTAFNIASVDERDCTRDQVEKIEGTRKIAHHVRTVTTAIASRPPEIQEPMWSDWALVDHRGGTFSLRRGNFSVRTDGRAHQVRRERLAVINTKVIASPGPMLQIR